MIKLRWMSVLCCLVGVTATAHDQIPGAPQTTPIVIKGATLHVMDGPAIADGMLLFEVGKITAVGKVIEVPEHAVEIDATGKHVFPGLIESMSDIGLSEISAVDATDDRQEFGDRNPNVRSWISVNPDSELIPVARANGVLAAMTAPQGNWLRGQAGVVYLDGWSVKDMVVLAPTGLCVNWRAMHPTDDDLQKQRTLREEKLAVLDALLNEARRYGEGRDQRPAATPSDLRLESLLPVIAGDRPLIVDADRQSEIESAIAYAQTQKLKLTIYGGYDAVACAELLKQYQIPVIVGSTHRLPLRRDDPYDAAYTLPERLRKAGVKFSIGGTSAGSPGGPANARNLPYLAAIAAAHGLPHQDALRSITLSAAEILGVSDRIGSLTVGKDASLFIADGDILETETNVTTAFIQGRAVDLGSRHKTLYEKYKLKYSR
jgi:imidazolonepropionase-like amidohydrolase